MAVIAQFEATLPPVVAVETTAHGWRGLTEDGQILNVQSSNGHAIEIPLGGSIAVMRNGQHIGYREVPKKLSADGLIDRYVGNFDAARRAMQANCPEQALHAVETAMACASTLTARYNRGMSLLELGRWQDGFADYAAAVESEGSSFMRPEFYRCLEHGLKRWRGEDLAGKRLLLIHDHGFGDSIMMLRYLPMLKIRGIDVVLWLPPELKRLALQPIRLADVVDDPAKADADYFCSLLFLLQVLKQSAESVAVEPYLVADPALVGEWWARLDHDEDIVGVAWSPGKTHSGDYPRAIPLQMLVEALPGKRLVSLQKQGREEAERLGVECYELEDFTDCAALMWSMHHIVTVDTAAVHLAGAIGHPRISLLLGHWASWRWRSPLYQNVQVCKQTEPGDWTSALTQL